MKGWVDKYNPVLSKLGYKKISCPQVASVVKDQSIVCTDCL